MATSDASALAASGSDPRPKPVAIVPPEPTVDPELRRRGNLVWAATISVMLFSALTLLRFLPTVGWPLVLAAIGAYLLDPVVTWSSRRGVSRPFASAVLMGTVVFLAVGAVLELLPKVIDQIGRIPAHFRDAIDIVLTRLAALGNKSIPVDFEQLLLLLRQHVPDVLARVLPGAGSVVGVLVGGSLSILTSVLGALIVPVVGYYLLKAWPDVVEGTVALVPDRQRPFFQDRMKEIDRVLNGFIRGQLTMAVVLSVLYTAGLSTVGLKMAVVVGLTTGFGNLVPYVGSATGLTLAVASCLVDFGVDYHLVLVVLMFLTIMGADSMFITPRIVGNRVGLSPAAVIVAVLACGSLFGFGGVLLAVPSAAILKVVLRIVVESYKDSPLYRDG